MIITDVVKKKIRERLNDLADDLATGQAQDWPHYRELVGEIKGLAEAEALIIEMEKHLDADDED